MISSVFASLIPWLDDYTDAIQQFLASKAVLAPLLLLFVEECGIPLPVPGDIILAYTGYRLSLNPSGPGIWQAFFTAQVAALLGSSILFFLSRRWGQSIIMKIGRFIFLKPEHIKHAERLFARWGALAIIVGRHIPGMRIPVTIFAATAGVRYRTFIISTFISTSLWILFYLAIGRRIGASFHTQIQQYVGVTLGVVFGVVVLFIAIHAIGLYREHHQVSKRGPSSSN